MADRKLAQKIRELDAKFAASSGSGGAAAPASIVNITTPAMTVSDAAARFLKSHGSIGPDGKFVGDSGVYAKRTRGVLIH